VRFVTTGALDLASAAAATTAPTRATLDVPRWLRRGAGVVGELLALVGVVLCIPFVILAIGMPIALLVRFLLWIGGAL
jgi:hypothetical protein